MKQQDLKWCGEGDLFSRPTLKTRKLYTSRRSRNSKRARNTESSHTVSHTGPDPPHAFRMPSNVSRIGMVLVAARARRFLTGTATPCGVSRLRSAL
jgi:hypothetical protein